MQASNMFKLLQILVFSLFLKVYSQQFPSHHDACSQRNWLISKYLPSLSGTVLFVGVDSYTKQYWQYVKNPELFETIDSLPSQAAYGSPFKHYIKDFLDFYPTYQYDHICLFGVMGHPPHSTIDGYYSIVTDEDNDQIITHAHNLLKEGGTLQLGPNWVSVPEFDFKYWVNKFSSPPLDSYEVLNNTFGSTNMLWQGQKKSEK